MPHGRLARGGTDRLRPPFPYWPPEDAEQLRRDLELTLAGEAPQGGFEMRIVRRNGDRFDARFYLSPLIDGEGRQTGWMASVTDITEPMRPRAALEAAQARFEAVLDGLDSAVFVADSTTDEILYANRAFMDLYGFDAIGQHRAQVPPPGSPSARYRVDPRRLGLEPCRWNCSTTNCGTLSGRWYHVRERAIAGSTAASSAWPSPPTLPTAGRWMRFRASTKNACSAPRA